MTWVNALSDADRERLNNIIHTRRIEINNKSIGHTDVPRKVVKIVRRTQGAGDMTNPNQ